MTIGVIARIGVPGENMWLINSACESRLDNIRKMSVSASDIMTMATVYPLVRTHVVIMRSYAIPNRQEIMS